MGILKKLSKGLLGMVAVAVVVLLSTLLLTTTFLSLAQIVPPVFDYFVVVQDFNSYNMIYYRVVFASVSLTVIILQLQWAMLAVVFGLDVLLAIKHDIVTRTFKTKIDPKPSNMLHRLLVSGATQRINGYLIEPASEHHVAHIFTLTRVAVKEGVYTFSIRFNWSRAGLYALHQFVTKTGYDMRLNTLVDTTLGVARFKDIDMKIDSKIDPAKWGIDMTERAVDNG